MDELDFGDRAQLLARQVRDLAAAAETPMQLWWAYGLAVDLDRALVSAGERLHRNGASFTALGKPFGITRQAARKRWGTEAER